MNDLFRMLKRQSRLVYESSRAAITQLGGRQYLMNPHTNKGSAFTFRERQELGFHGLLPPTLLDIETQLKRVVSNYNRQPSDLAKYKFLMDLGDRNEILFYKGMTHYYS